MPKRLRRRYRCSRQSVASSFKAFLTITMCKEDHEVIVAIVNKQTRVRTQICATSAPPRSMGRRLAEGLARVRSKRSISLRSRDSKTSAHLSLKNGRSAYLGQSLLLRKCQKRKRMLWWIKKDRTIQWLQVWRSHFLHLGKPLNLKLRLFHLYSKLMHKTQLQTKFCNQYIKSSWLQNLKKPRVTASYKAQTALRDRF